MKNREIKFRAWDKVNGWMIPDFDNWVDFGGKYWTTPDTTFNTPHQEIVQQVGVILMQYSGLKDKKGKEIYEGDIVHFQDWDTDINHKNKSGYDDVDEGEGVVTFGHTVNWANMPGVSYTHGWFLDITENSSEKYKTTGYFRGLEQNSIEVIGNIYENPELLKGGELK